MGIIASKFSAIQTSLKNISKPLSQGFTSITNPEKAVQNHLANRTTNLNLQTSMSRAASLVGYVAMYQLLNKPDVILGIIPLYNVQTFEVATSLDDLKYRSIGGEFLAYQHGGHLACRIDAILFGGSEATIVAALKTLQIYGDTQQNKLDSTLTDVGNYGIRSDGSITTKSVQNADLSTIEKGKDYDPDDDSYLTRRYHRTFVVYTSKEILFNMYIETFRYEWSVKNGIKCLHVNILLRQYIPPPVPENVNKGLIKKTKYSEIEDSMLNKTYKPITTYIPKKRVTFIDPNPQGIALFDQTLNLANAIYMNSFVNIPSQSIKSFMTSNRNTDGVYGFLFGTQPSTASLPYNTIDYKTFNTSDIDGIYYPEKYENIRSTNKTIYDIYNLKNLSYINLPHSFYDTNYIQELGDISLVNGEYIIDNKITIITKNRMLNITSRDKSINYTTPIEIQYNKFYYYDIEYKNKEARITSDGRAIDGITGVKRIFIRYTQTTTAKIFQMVKCYNG